MTGDSKWDICVTTPLRQERGVLDLSPNTNTCTGRLFNESGELSIEDGRIEDGVLSWNLRLNRPIPMKITCRAQIHGNRLEGTATVAAFGDITFTGTRQAG